MIFDLDPPSDDDFALVRRTARELGDILREAGVEPFAMTTGSRGIHIVVALQRRYAFDAVRDAAVAVATELVARRPNDLTIEFYRRKREGRLFVGRQPQRLRGDRGSRPTRCARSPGAPVATPLALGRALRPAPARPALDAPHRARARSRPVGGPARRGRRAAARL